jgi:hypothetical protein
LILKLIIEKLTTINKETIVKTERMRKQPIKDLLNCEEKPVLEALYLESAVATDQLKRSPDTLRKLTAVFNKITSRDFDQNKLLRYIINRRKAKDWPRLGPKAKKFPSVLNLLTSAQLEALKQIYLDLDVPSDEFLFEPNLMREVARRFEGLTGTRYNSPILIAAIVAKRKRGLWVKIREPFADVEAIVDGTA